MTRFILIGLMAGAVWGQQGWWMREPIRWMQNNIRETDDGVDTVALAERVAEYRANVLLFGMGGIAAHYPTEVEFHQRSAHLPAGKDTFGEVLRECHRRKIRVVGRFDFSKTVKAVYDAHPEWFFRKSNGEPVIYNGLYSTCINGGYYRVQAMKILDEALTRYAVDGLFFNMFGNQATDYSGRVVGLCHCGECERRFRAAYGRGVPEVADGQYEEFMFKASREVAAEIGKLIQARRPEAGYFNYIQQYTDGIMSESNTAVRRALPLWPYMSSDNVNRARNSEPGKMAVNLNQPFVDFPWRFAMVAGPEMVLRLWQNVAHGGAAAVNMHGVILEQADRSALEAARPVYRWLAEHEGLYVGQRSAAKVLLLGKPPAGGRDYPQQSYRGWFRLLSEQHIPFQVADNLAWMGREKFDVVIATNWAPAELDAYVREGGRVIVATARRVGMTMPRVVKEWKGVEGYFRVRERALLPSLERTDLVLLNGDYTEYEGARGALTLVPPSMFGPPEKVHVDMVDTEKPGLLQEVRGKGKVTVIPWDVGAQYYALSLESHAGLMKDVVDGMLPQGRQVVTNAHPLVEMTVMRQGRRTLVHLMNLSGHSQTAYFAPVPMGEIRVALEGTFQKARAERAGRELRLRQAGGRSEFVVPGLGEYEVVVLE